MDFRTLLKSKNKEFEFYKNNISINLINYRLIKF